jgi:hypothetical protein
MRGQPREAPPDYIERESHYLWGKRYLLTISEKDEPPKVENTHRQIILQIRPGASNEKREEVLAGWYREQIRQVAPILIARWEPMLGVKVKTFFIQHMKLTACRRQAVAFRRVPCRWGAEFRAGDAGATGGRCAPVTGGQPSHASSAPGFPVVQPAAAGILGS